MTFNRRFSKFIYLPVALCILIAFTVSNAVMFPAAYFKALIHKFILYRRTRQYAYLNKAMFFLLFGIPIFIINQLYDSYAFFVNLYAVHQTRSADSLRYPKISLKAFNMFHFLVHKREGDYCNAKDLVLETRDAFKTNECIFGVLYANRSSMIEKKISLRKELAIKSGEYEMNDLNQDNEGQIEGSRIKLSAA